MDPEEAARLKSNYCSLIKDIKPKIEDVSDFLCKNGVITDTMKEKILSQRTPTSQASKLLDMLPNRGKRAYNSLYEACKCYCLVHSADILKEENAPHKKVSRGPDNFEAVSQDHEELFPDTWPTEAHAKRVLNNQIRVRPVAKDSQSYELYEQHRNMAESIYPMYHKIRGNALLIVNEVFLTPTLAQRKGSRIDREGLRQLFDGLGFSSDEVHKDLNAKKIKDLIEKETKADHSNHDCFVFFIGSYGSRGNVRCTEGSYISFNEDIIAKICEVEDLKTKPKLFFFQACQGKKKLRGTQPQNTEEEPLGRQNNSEDTNNTTDSDDMTIIERDDCFILRSSPDGSLSYRNEDWGSWFTQAVVKIFSEHAHNTDFYNLFLKVNDLVSKAETRNQKMKNAAELMASRCQKLYFFPGQYHQE